jgi:hypothetical protein
MTVQVTIYHKLAAIGTAYPDALPANPTLPSMSYKFISLSQQRHHGGNSLARYRLQVDCWAKTRGAANTLADSVKTALDLNQTGIELITVEQAIDFNDVETGIERRMLEFYVWDT